MSEIRTDRMTELIANLNTNQGWTASEAFEVYDEIIRLEGVVREWLDRRQIFEGKLIDATERFNQIADDLNIDISHALWWDSSEETQQNLVFGASRTIQDLQAMDAKRAERLQKENAELQAEVLALFRKGQTLIDEKADLQRDIERYRIKRGD